MYRQDYKDKVILVTGGTSGIGLAAARGFVASGGRVIIVGRNAEKGAEALKMLQREQGEAHFFSADVANSGQLNQLFNEIQSRYGQLDVAFNNAATVQGEGFKPLHAVSEEEYDRGMQLNLKSIWLCMKHELAFMLKQGSGVILNTSSINGLGGVANNAIYSAAKAGILGLTKSAAQEYAGQGIRINALVAGPFDTPMLQGVFSKLSPEKPELAQEAFEKQIPLGRIGTPEEAAEAVLWLCSARSSFLTGSSFIFDGGLTSAFR